MQADDEGSQQRQEDHGRPHRRARVRDHPPAFRPEPHPGPRRRHRQHRPARGLDSYWFPGHRPPSGRRRLPSAPGKPGHLPLDHRRAYIPHIYDGQGY